MVAPRAVLILAATDLIAPAIPVVAVPTGIAQILAIPAFSILIGDIGRVRITEFRGQRF
jgi:hypothetical protein